MHTENIANNSQLASIITGKTQSLANHHLYSQEMINTQHKSPAVSTKKLYDRDCLTKNNYNDLRELFGGKGTSLQLIENAHIAVPLFKLISVDEINSLMDYQLNAAIVKKNFPSINIQQLPEYSITAIKNYATNLGNQDLETQKEILSNLTTFICSEEFYHHIQNTDTANNIRLKYNDLIAPFEKNIPIIVRSSSIAEDNYGDAQAGKYESIVHKHNDILKTCLDVVASSFNPEICMLTPKPISLILQQCIDCSFGGVAMSYSSLQDNSMRIEYTVGQPKAVVAGQSAITAHSYLIKRDSGFQAEFTAGDIKLYYSLEKNTTTDGYIEKLQELTDSNKSQKLDQDIIVELKTHLQTLENIFLCPVDVEFAIDKNNKLFILQVRPITRLSGNVDFAMNAPKEALASGKLISEGFCTGSLVKFDSTEDITTIPPGAIIYADHGHDKMLEHNFLQHVGGFILKHGSLNNHVAIMLRQASKPCTVINNDFSIDDYNNLAITLVCGNFNGISGAYLVDNNLKEKLEASISSSTKPITNKTTKLVNNRQSAIIKFLRPDTGFTWLDRKNNDLLDYFDSQRLLIKWLSSKGLIQLSMLADRSTIFKEITAEVNYFIDDTKIFLAGFRRFLLLATRETTSISNNKYLDNQAKKTLNAKIKSIAELTIKLDALKNEIINNLSTISTQLNSDSVKILPTKSFTQWLHDGKSLLASMQTLTMPQSIDEISSIHDFIFWIHKEFIDALALVAIGSGLGEVTKTGKKTLIDFTCNTGVLTENYNYAILSLNCETKVLMLENTFSVNINLGLHKASVVGFEQADGGKGRTLRLRLSDDFSRSIRYEASLKRFWFLTQLLKNIGIDKNSANMEISVNEATGILIIECTHIQNKQALELAFIKLILALHSIRDLNMYLDEIILFEDVVSWNCLTLEKTFQNFFSKENQDAFAYALFIFSYNLTTPIYYINNNYKFIVNIARELKDTNNLENIQNILNKVPENQRQKILYYFLIADYQKASPLIENEYDWFRGKDLVFKLVPKNRGILQFLDSKPANDKEVAVEPVHNHQESLEFASKKLQNNKKNVLTRVKQNGYELEYASDDLKDDAYIVLAAVKQDGSALEYASKELQDNEKIVLEAVNQSGSALEHASERLKQDKDIVLAAIQQTDLAIEHASEELLENDEDIVLFLVENEVDILENVSQKLQNNKEVVLAAVQQNGLALEFANKELQNNKEVVLAAIQQNALALEFASKDLQKALR